MNPADVVRLWEELQRSHAELEQASSFAEWLSGFDRPVVHDPDEDGHVWVSGRIGRREVATNLTLEHPDWAVEARADAVRSGG
jgi:hypothetical protein